MTHITFVFGIYLCFADAFWGGTRAYTAGPPWNTIVTIMKEGKAVCMGVLANAVTILTSAHCLADYDEIRMHDPRSFRILVGLASRPAHETQNVGGLKVEFIWIHDEYLVAERKRRGLPQQFTTFDDDHDREDAVVDAEVGIDIGMMVLEYPVDPTDWERTVNGHKVRFVDFANLNSPICGDVLMRDEEVLVSGFRDINLGSCTFDGFHEQTDEESFEKILSELVNFQCQPYDIFSYTIGMSQNDGPQNFDDADAPDDDDNDNSPAVPTLPQNDAPTIDHDAQQDIIDIDNAINPLDGGDYDNDTALILDEHINHPAAPPFFRVGLGVHQDMAELGTPEGQCRGYGSPIMDLAVTDIYCPRLPCTFTLKNDVVPVKTLHYAKVLVTQMGGRPNSPVVGPDDTLECKNVSIDIPGNTILSSREFYIIRKSSMVFKSNDGTTKVMSRFKRRRRAVRRTGVLLGTNRCAGAIESYQTALQFFNPPGGGESDKAYLARVGQIFLTSKTDQLLNTVILTDQEALQARCVKVISEPMWIERSMITEPEITDLNRSERTRRLEDIEVIYQNQNGRDYVYNSNRLKTMSIRVKLSRRKPDWGVYFSKDNCDDDDVPIHYQAALARYDEDLKDQNMVQRLLENPGVFIKAEKPEFGNFGEEVVQTEALDVACIKMYFEDVGTEMLVRRFKIAAREYGTTTEGDSGGPVFKKICDQPVQECFALVALTSANHKPIGLGVHYMAWVNSHSARQFIYHPERHTSVPPNARHPDPLRSPRARVTPAVHDDDVQQVGLIDDV